VTSNDNNYEERIFEQLLEYLQQVRGFDFTGYKRSTLKRRVQKRMHSCGIENFGDYLDYLEVHPEEFAPLFNTILINVTAFFRDPDAWQQLQTQILPNLLKEKNKGEPIRVWSTGCASGEEAYTAAMILAEALGIEQFRERVKIYATDVDEGALNKARHATYGAEEIEPIPEELQLRYLEPIGNLYRIRSEIRSNAIFGRHDLVQDAPISRSDLLICRNTLMYFNSETQGQVLARLHFALNQTGVLFLGKAEMLFTRANLFTPINLKHRIFSKVAKVNLRDRLLVLAQGGNEEASNNLSNHVRLREVTFNTSPISQIVVEKNGNLVLANRKARLMFDIKFQDLGKPLQNFEVSYRPLELRSRIEEIYNTGELIIVSDLKSHISGQVRYFDVQFLPLQENGSDVIGVSITFTETTHYHQLQEELATSKQELETTNEELQSSNEELETTNEELQSSNEELETTNEELQSSNEELETMNEELQSSNEELQTVNDELRLRTQELDETNAFLNSILTSLQAGVIVIDRQGYILAWNPEATNIWGLRAEEVEGESLFSLDMGLPVGELQKPIRECLAGETNQELLLQAVNRRGRSLQCRVSLYPLSGIREEVRGVIVLTEEGRSEE
jgi:two-component system CheB/CheR fusion protein